MPKHTAPVLMQASFDLFQEETMPADITPNALKGLKMAFYAGYLSAIRVMHGEAGEDLLAVTEFTAQWWDGENSDEQAHAE